MLIKNVITLLGDTNEQIKIGAPWGINNSIFRDNAMNERGEAIERLPDSERVGNGGLSLRSVQAMIDACNIGSGHSSPKEQEDVFMNLRAKVDRNRTYVSALLEQRNQLPLVVTQL